MDNDTTAQELRRDALTMPLCSNNVAAATIAQAIAEAQVSYDNSGHVTRRQLTTIDELLFISTPSCGKREAVHIPK